MDHHPVSDIDAHMTCSAGVVGSLEENQVSGFGSALRNNRAYLPQAFRRQPSIAPAVPAVIDDPGHEP